MHYIAGIFSGYGYKGARNYRFYNVGGGLGNIVTNNVAGLINAMKSKGHTLVYIIIVKGKKGSW